VDSSENITALFDTLGTATRVYYVATNGADSNPGTKSQPWRTIQHASSTVTAGAKVIVGPGEYNEFVNLITSGTAANPIVFEGTRGSDGTWLTVVSPATVLNANWVAAPEIGSGVWKQPGMTFATRELTIAHKRAAFVYTMGDITSWVGSVYAASGFVTGTNLLTQASTAIVTNGSVPFRFWDGIEALYSVAGTGPYTLYLRFRNGDNPNGMDIRACKNNNNAVTDQIYGGTAINISSASYVAFRNFMIRDAFCGVFVQNSSSTIWVENNQLVGGSSGVAPWTGAHNVFIRNNDFLGNWFGFADLGAWQAGVEYRYQIRSYLYRFSKYLMGQSSTCQRPINSYLAGSSNVICGNYIFQSLGEGISIKGAVTGPTVGTEVCDNIIQGHISAGLLSSEGQFGTRMHRNDLSDCNIIIRLHALNTIGETNRTVDIYRNTSWLPDGIGDHLFAFANSSGGTYYPVYRIYHNSFSGGYAGLEVNSYAVIPKVYMLNNIISDTPCCLASSSFYANASYLGAFDYNLVKPLGGGAAWYGSHNLSASTSIWPSVPGMSFQLPFGSSAIDSALDTTQNFTLGGTTYSALPDDATKYGTAWDMGALEFTPFLQPATGLHVISTGP
jgi:hypothetical protein